MFYKKGPHSWLRLICTVLWIFVVAGLYYQNRLLQAQIRNLERPQSKMLAMEDDAQDEKEAMTIELAALTNENTMYSAELKREHINLKECMSTLPQKEIDNFYRRHREELLQAQAKAP